jgi:DNA primase
MSAALSDIIGRRVALERRTRSSFAGLCPFHAERTPSFTVDDATGVFHCYGCGARGDATGFASRLAEIGGRQ